MGVLAGNVSQIGAFEEVVEFRKRLEVGVSRNLLSTEGIRCCARAFSNTVVSIG